MDNTSIYVVTHKQSEIPKLEGYIPIVVGSHNANYDNCCYDNTGDNISEKNPNYCELTALYWVWKNDKFSSDIGLCHYRRYFHSDKFVPNEKQVCDYLNSRDVRRILKNHDIILPMPVWFGGITVEEQFLSTSINKKDLEILRNVIYKLCPEYINAYDKTLNSYSMSICNMFVMPRKYLDDYCSWLFSILFEFEKNVDLKGYTPYYQRIFGFVGERLLNVYVKKNKLKIKYLFPYDYTNKLLSRKSCFTWCSRLVLDKLGILDVICRCKAKNRRFKR